MFERHKEKKEQEEYQAALAMWQHDHEQLANLIQVARTGTGYPSSLVLLRKGEALIASVTNASLVETRKGAGHWEGHSSGVSVPIASIGGRSIRYRVGSSKGHYVQGTPHPAAVDTGTMAITDQRLVFLGGSKTLECQFAKLIGIQRLPGELAVSVSNRQKTTVLHFGSLLDDWVEVRLDLALAMFNGQASAFADRLETQLRELEAHQPRPPAPTPS